MNTFTAALLAAVTIATPDVAFESMGTFKLKNAAFPTVTKFEDSEKFLLCSSFGALSSGAIYVVPDISEAVTNDTVSKLKSEKLKTPSFEWPNDVQVIPQEVFGYRAIMVPDGFLVPGKTNGGLYIITMDETDITLTKSTTKISAKNKGYFFHMGEWVDLNGDGRLDFLTARSNAKAGGGQLVWFEHPAEGLTDATWTEHVISEGPDVGIQVVEVSQYKNEVVVFAAEFFNERVSFYRVSTKTGELVDMRVIDTTIESAYSVTYADLNGDGVKELMVNNHETNNPDTGIWVYEFPKNWMTGDFTRTTIASNFQNKFSLAVPNMAPGFPYPFYPEVSTEGKKGVAAHIVVAGDGDHTAHIMTPTDAKNFVWDLDTVKEEKGTVGALTWDDLDLDGWNELWVPDYDSSKIEVFKFSALQANYFLQ
jgi:hypothetical protein